MSKVNSIHLFTGYEDNSKFIVSRDTNYFPTAKQREIVDVEGDNKLAIVRIASK
jgi:hypothetical protein